jgi:hypothetical protein
MSTFCGNTKDDIYHEMSQWAVEGQGAFCDDDTIAPDGCFYEEAASEIKSALIKGNFPPTITDTTPIAYDYIAAIHRKMTALLYIQSRRLNITVDGMDSTRGQWAALRNKLSSISRGEPFGELKNPRGSIAVSQFYSEDCSPYSNFMPINRAL